MLKHELSYLRDSIKEKLIKINNDEIADSEITQVTTSIIADCLIYIGDCIRYSAEKR